MRDMPYYEFVCWQEYLTKRPAGWREDHRAAVIAKCFYADFNPTQVFPSLATIQKSTASSDKFNICKSAFGQFARKAVGGEKPEWL